MFHNSIKCPHLHKVPFFSCKSHSHTRTKNDSRIHYFHLTFTNKAFTLTSVRFRRNAIIYLQLVLFPVDDDGADLLVHEYKDGDEESGHEASQINPPRVLPKRHDDPATVWTRGLRDGKRKGVKVLVHLKRESTENLRGIIRKVCEGDLGLV